MGWWETGQGDDIIGDAPADTITETLEALASSFEEQGKPKPTLQEVLDAIFSVLRHKGADIFENREEISIQNLVAELEPTCMKVLSRENVSADEQLVKAFDEAIEEIIIQYQDGANRKPRSRELLASIKFVLGYKPNEYLSIEKDISVKKLWLE